MSRVEPRGNSASGPRVNKTAPRPNQPANARANSRTFAAAGNRADSCSGCGGRCHRADILALAASAGDFAFGVGGLFPTGIGAARCRQVNLPCSHWEKSTIPGAAEIRLYPLLGPDACFPAANRANTIQLE